MSIKVCLECNAQLGEARSDKQFCGSDCYNENTRKKKAPFDIYQLSIVKPNANDRIFACLNETGDWVTGNYYHPNQVMYYGCKWKRYFSLWAYYNDVMRVFNNNMYILSPLEMQEIRAAQDSTQIALKESEQVNEQIRQANEIAKIATLNLNKRKDDDEDDERDLATEVHREEWIKSIFQGFAIELAKKLAVK